MTNKNLNQNKRIRFAIYTRYSSLVSAKAELTKDLDEKLKAANVKKSVVKLIQIDVSS